MKRTIKVKVPFKSKTKKRLQVAPKQARALLVKKYVMSRDRIRRKQLPFGNSASEAAKEREENQSVQSHSYAVNQVERAVSRSFSLPAAMARQKSRKKKQAQTYVEKKTARKREKDKEAKETSAILLETSEGNGVGSSQRKLLPHSKKRQIEPLKHSSNNPLKKEFFAKGKKTREHIVSRCLAVARKLMKSMGISSIAAGVVLVILLTFAAISAMVASPFGLFFSGQDGSSDAVKPLTAVVNEVNGEFEQRIADILLTVSHDSYTITYERSADNVRTANWPDVVAVFAVKASLVNEDANDVVTMDEKRIAELKRVFWDMNQINYTVETIHHDDWTERILHITVSVKTAEEQAEDYGFTADQRAVVKEMLAAELRPYLFALLGLDTDVGLSPEELKELLAELPEGDIGAALVALALTRLGDPYSQPLAGKDDYVDCSYLVQWCYAQLGISIPRTAAEQAKFSEKNGQVVAYEDLQPGDLIFWSFEKNGRYKDIGHMGIYAGNGMVIDASYSKQMVVYREMYSLDAVVSMERYGVLER